MAMTDQTQEPDQAPEDTEAAPEPAPDPAAPDAADPPASSDHLPLVERVAALEDRMQQFLAGPYGQFVNDVVRELGL